MSISIISAVAKNGVIGKGNDLPWNLPRDLKHFASVTTGHSVVMGFNTYKSIFSRLGKPLPNRRNYVIAPDPTLNAPGCEMIRDFDSWVKKAMNDTEEIFVIGGAMLYRTTLPFASKLYITQVSAEVDGDAFFPEIDTEVWNLVKEEPHKKDEKNEYDLNFCVYERKK